jgi:hypothetical protein
LKTDAFLLSDICENFRDVSMTNYFLDPAHYLTTLSLTWDACLKLTKVESELITDSEIILFLRERNAKWHSDDQQPFCAGQQSPSESRGLRQHSAAFLHILSGRLYLYGWAMSQYIPVGDFRFLSEDEIKEIDFANVLDNSEIGYMVGCDVMYPSELHQLHNDY